MRAADHFRVTGCLLHQLAQDDAQAELVQYRVLEGAVKVHSVMVTAAILADVQHIRPSKVANDPPDGTPSERHRLRYPFDRAVGINGNVKEDRAVAGYEIPIVFYSHMNSITFLVSQ